MRFVSLILAFCLSLNVMAAAGTVPALEDALDQYHYDLSVEWDQKDQKFFDLKTVEFFSKLSVLIKDQGLSQEEIMTVVKNKSSNPELVNALKLKLSLLSKGASMEELTQMVKDASKEIYSQGASWNGRSAGYLIVPLLFGAIVGYSIWWRANHECVAWEQQYVCNTYNNCVYGDDYYGGGYYGGGYYSGGYCYSRYTTCGYVDVCTQYQRK